MESSNKIRFKINGIDKSVGCEVSSYVTLLDYIRDTVGLKGTKYMCRQGGCGACIVSVAKTQNAAPLAVNSCMISVTSCHNWDITTIEKVGNRADGYHQLQKTLADDNGTQCGYCTPGWIMAMYSLLKGKGGITMLEIEESLSSNICRCTGYRSILTAFKKFANDASEPQSIPDIEDLQLCEKTGIMCRSKCLDDLDAWCFVTNNDLEYGVININLRDGKKWIRVKEINEIINILKSRKDDSYILVAGNTAKGVYPIDDYPQLLIDISDVSALKGYVIDQNLMIGAGTTLTEFLNMCQILSKQEYFGYLEKFCQHLQKVAHIAVRNIGSVAGNLMIKYHHNEFPSDIFLLLETVGAFITILNFNGQKQVLSMTQFLKLDMKGKLILNVLLPPLNKDYKILTYKVMPRSQNARAIVNAGFLYRFKDKENKVQSNRIVFGGLSSNFIRATATEKYLVGKNLFVNDTLQAALKILKKELIVTENPPQPSASYRRHLALALLYKGLLTLCPIELVKGKYQSGVTQLHDTRPVSEGRQVYDTKMNLWPLTKPISKIDALIQCSGEAFYTEDLPIMSNEVYAAYVLSTIPKGNIVTINPGNALKEPGVIAVYTAKDIPGLNSYTALDDPTVTTNEEVLCSGEVKYYNQPVAIVVASSRQVAEKATKMVEVTYNDVTKPVIDIKNAKEDPHKAMLFATRDAKDKGSAVHKVINGNSTIYGQNYFTMETLVCITRPIEQGLEVYSTSQFLDAVQVMTSRALNVDQNKIDVYVRRVGGAYGLKITRNTQVAVGCSLAALKLNRPCRIVQSLTTNTRAVGKRFPCSADYELGINPEGVIQYLNLNVFEDNGYIVNELLMVYGVKIYNNCYDASRWSYKCYNVITDTAKNSWFRSPGTLEAIAMVEIIMERISYEMYLDPIQVRLSNLDEVNHGDLREMVENLKSNSDYKNRRFKVDKFNMENRWKKRGLRLSFLRWKHEEPRYFDVNIAVYHGDGTVIITHGGVEIGQGINTRAVQVCGYLLNIPLEKIQVKTNSTTTSPNAAVTGGSITSQNIVVGVQRACEDLLKKLDPIKKEMKNATWEEIIKKAYSSSIDLQSHGFVSPNIQRYDIYGVTLAEVEVDILTGETEIIRVDILEDVGQSISPKIDVGQIEGAFVMGIGYWMTEELVYNNESGELLTDRTWNYHVPLARDIPQDFRIYFRKNSYSNKTIFGAKAVGEPPMCMAIAVPFAIREAISAARSDNGIPTTTWFDIDGPYTVEKICMASETKPEDFKFF